MTAPSSPPADGQVREAAVEAVARWLHGHGSDADARWELFADRYHDWRKVQAADLLALPAVSALVDKARADELDQAIKQVQAIYDMQCPARPKRYVSHGAWVAHRWWETCLGGELDRLRDRATSIRAAIRQTEGNNR
jgi:uncharacterized protein (UPF0264 family)